MGIGLCGSIVHRSGKKIKAAAMPDSLNNDTPVIFAERCVFCTAATIIMTRKGHKKSPLHPAIIR